MIKELDVVALTHDIPERNLKKGDSGAVVHCYKKKGAKAWAAFEVEFVNDKGETAALLTLGPEDIQPLKIQ